MSSIVQFIIKNLLVVLVEFLAKLAESIASKRKRDEEKKAIQTIGDMLKDQDYKKRMEAAKKADDLLTKK